MKITFDTESTELKTRVADAFAEAYNWQAQVQNEAGELVDNPETKANLVVRKVKEFIKETVRSVEASTAIKTAREAAITKADNEITL